MEEFLLSRNVSRAIIDKLRDDKIDRDTVLLMNDDNLRGYLPAYGDRVALRAFARSSQTRPVTDSNLNNTGLSRLQRRTFGYGNRNALRLKRTVGLGWMNFNEKLNCYKQVRSPNGGGTRHFYVEKSLLIQDLYEIAFTTFFPHGLSKYGRRDEFIGEIRDFNGNSVIETSTVNQLYENCRMKTMRIYLYMYTRKVAQHVTVPQTTFLESGTPEVTFHPRQTGILQDRSEINSSLQAGPLRPAAQTPTLEEETPWLHTRTLPHTERLPAHRPAAQTSTLEEETPWLHTRTLPHTESLPSQRPAAQTSTLEEETPWLHTRTLPHTESLPSHRPAAQTSTLEEETPWLLTRTLPHTESLRSHRQAAQTSTLQEETPWLHTRTLPHTESLPSQRPAAQSSTLEEETPWLHTRTLPHTESLPSQSLQEGICVVDSEDEALQEAIEASFQNETTEKEPVSLAEVLAEFQGAIEAGDSKTKIIVFREQILQSTFRALERKSINLKAGLFVKFSGEIGEDYGGPRREFFRLAFNALYQSPYFEGPNNKKIFKHNLHSCETNRYQLIGRLVGLALAQDGPGLHFLDSNMYDLMVGKDINLKEETIPCLPEETKEMIEQLENTETAQDRDRFLVQFGDSLVDQGMGNPYSMKIDELLHMVKKTHLYYRISSEIAQFSLGINEVCGEWFKNADVLKPLFCDTPKELTSSDMSALFKFNLSVKGSNSRREEDVTQYAFEVFLLSIEDGEIPLTFSDLLIFVSGADSIPPCGFSKKIEIEFYSMESESVRRLPSVSTCSLTMLLPRGQDPDSLSTLLMRSIKESAGFLKI